MIVDLLRVLHFQALQARHRHAQTQNDAGAREPVFTRQAQKLFEGFHLSSVIAVRCICSHCAAVFTFEKILSHSVRFSEGSGARTSTRSAARSPAQGRSFAVCIYAS